MGLDRSVARKWERAVRQAAGADPGGRGRSAYLFGPSVAGATRGLPRATNSGVALASGSRRSSSVVEQGTHKSLLRCAVLSRVGPKHESGDL